MFHLLLLCFVLTTAELTTVAHTTTESTAVQKTSDPDPPSPAQPQDFIIVIANYCNTTAKLSRDNSNLWEGSFKVNAPDTIASQLSGTYKYGFEVQADTSSHRINGTLQYTNPPVFVDFFSVVGEWGVSVSFDAKVAKVETTQADVGPLSVYTILVGHGETC